MEREVLKTINHSYQTVRLHIFILPVLVNEKKMVWKKNKELPIVSECLLCKNKSLELQRYF